MHNKDRQQNNSRDYTVSFVCIVLSAILMLVLGVLPKIPSGITKLLRPAFIALCLITVQNSRYYKLGATKYHIVNLAYYTIIFLSFPINSETMESYISIMLFIFFFIFAANRQWTKRELFIILTVVIVACDIQSIILLTNNPGMLKNSSSQHLDFLGAVVNRNSPAYAITAGAFCGMFLLLYDRYKKSLIKDMFYLVSCLLCSFTIFAIGCRGAFVGAAVGLFCIMWQKTRDAGDYRERFWERVFAMVLVLVVLFTAMNISEGTYSSRLFDFGEEASDSGRDELWDAAWVLINEKPVFGGGFDYWTSTGHVMGTHNTFLTFMVSTGWVGGILLGFFLLMALLEMFKTRNLIPLAFMATFFMHSWAEPGMDYYAYVPLILAFVITRYLQYKNKDLQTLFE